MKERRSRRRIDWRAWVRRGGLAGALAFPFAPGWARACDEPADRYPRSVTVGVNIGFSLGQDLRFAYGLDVRLGQGPIAGFTRLEGRGATLLRLSSGIQGLRDIYLGEAGLAFQTRHRNSDIGWSAGPHLGVATRNWLLGAQMEGTVPAIGDHRNYDVTFAGLFFPYTKCSTVGRLLRSGESAVMPVVECAPEPRDEGPRSREEAALERAWIEAAQGEYASVWAFVRMAGELRAVGAPEALVEAAFAAAEDELRHAGACVDLSGARFLMRPLSRLAATPRWASRSPEAIADLAREAWLDGCLGEGIAATQAGEAAGASRDPRTAAAHAQIARDERRHAELAWRVLAWAWQVGGAPARDAVMAAAEKPPLPRGPGIGADLDRDWLEAHGWPGPAAQGGAAEGEASRAVTRLRRLGA